jgi:hypothetical protein
MTAGMRQIGLELGLPIVAATYKRVGIMVTHPLGREDGAKQWVESGGNRRNAKATRRIDLPRTLGYSSWKPKYPISRTKLKKKKREGMFHPIRLLYPRQNLHKPLTHLGRARN